MVSSQLSANVVGVAGAAADVGVGGTSGLVNDRLGSEVGRVTSGYSMRSEPFRQRHRCEFER